MTPLPRRVAAGCIVTILFLAAGCADVSQGRTELRSTHVTGTSPPTTAADRPDSPGTTIDRLDRPDFPDGYDEDLAADLVAAGFGTTDNPPRVDVSNFDHNVTVSLPNDADAATAVPLCERVATYAFGPQTPPGTVALVTVKPDAFEPGIAAQRTDTDTGCRTTGFTYEFVNDELKAEYPDAPWLDRVNGSSQSGVGDDVRYTVSVTAGTTADDALAICRAAAEYAFSSRAGRRATRLEVIADPADPDAGGNGDGGTTLARTTTADGCAAA